MEKKKWFKTWWGILLAILFWVIAIPVIIFQSGLSKRNKILSFIGFVVLVFVVLGSIPPVDEQVLKENEIKAAKAKEEKEAKKKAEKEKRQAESARQDDLNYEVLRNSRDTSNLTKKENTIDILVKDNISEESLKKVMRKAGKEQIRDADILFIRAYGDKKFFNLGGETHGMITYYPDGTVKNETYRAKKEIPSDKEKDIYIDYSKTLHETLKSKGNYTKQEEENIEEEINKKIAKKYGISPEEVEKIFDKVVIYQGM